MSAYYNEHDKFAAAWLRELIKEGLIADGEVDERDIQDVRPDDLTGFVQCHFFAGIGGWSYALRLADWSDTQHVWTGSCPCQPFSQAGRRTGGIDERHIWPAWFHLIENCLPSVVFGEQVESAVNYGWLDLVHDDMEGIGYTVAPIGLPAACVGAPHIRQRLWFVAHYCGANTYAHQQGRSAVTVPNGRVGREEGHGQALTARRSVWASEPKPASLADGIPGALEQVRGYGNAIVPQVAAAFISAYMESAV